MSVYNTSEDDLVGLFNKKTTLAVVRSDLIFGVPEVNLDSSKARNTKIRIAIRMDHPSLAGAEDFYIDRLDLSRLSSYPAPGYPPISPVGTSVYSMLGKIKSSMGLDFTTADLVETFVTEGGEAGYILLKAKPTSLGWIGEFNLPLGSKPLLSSLFVRDYILWS